MNDYENFMSECEIYSEEEMDVVDKYISEKFGKFENVLHEIFSPDIHVDICIIEPSEDKPYYQLVTMGMGAHRMNVPKELSEYKLERAELSICLPPDWKLNESDEVWYWPIRTLKSIARLPKECNTWLGWGHTIDNGSPYADNTELSASLLVNPLLGDAEDCVLPNGEKVNFYQLFPIYREEMQYKIQNSAESLIDLLTYIDFNDVFIVTPGRENAADYINASLVMDNIEWHVGSITDKNLPIDEINGYNHMAIYFRWCIENDLMGEAFEEEYENVIESVKNHDGTMDLRKLLQNEELLEQFLTGDLFSPEGFDFAYWYYRHENDETRCYPHDIDTHALKYFGEERYNSDEFKNEAYLFVPFDEKYYQDMKAVINEKYEIWQQQQEEDSEACIATKRILVDGCKVGYCYREEPDEAFSDSGWRFLAGDESEEYLDDPDNSGVYELSVICELDEEILKIIDSPYGSAFERNEQGKLVPVNE